MSSHLAYLVLGSNLGDRSTNLANAKTEISALSETKILKESEIYKSPAYGPIEQPFFFNLALEVETSFAPLLLLEHLQKIEKKLKREKDSHMQPRTTHHTDTAVGWGAQAAGPRAAQRQPTRPISAAR